MLGIKSNGQRQKYALFTEEEKRIIIEDHLQSGLPKERIWLKYTGRRQGASLILYWMRKYGYLTDNKKNSGSFSETELRQKHKVSKSILGLPKETNLRKKYFFNENQRRSIIEDYLRSGLSKRAIWKKYTGCDDEHGQILRWMRQYDYISKEPEKSVTFASKNSTMISQNNDQSSLDFENYRLRKRISELEKQLSESEMKSIAWQTMVEIAEREFDISIKKKFNTKPLKR
jgi:hypothetical protein